AVEQVDVVADEARQRDRDRKHLDGRSVLEGVARDAVVDDRLRNAERQEIENLRKQDETQDHELLVPTVPPDIGEEIALHRYSGGPAQSTLYSISALITFDILRRG